MSLISTGAKPRRTWRQFFLKHGEPPVLFKPKSQIAPFAIPFQDVIDEISEELPPPFMRSTQYLIVALFLLLLLIGWLIKVDVVVVGTGRLTTEVAPMMMQPLQTAMIRELNVRAGDTVTKGQVLATLDPTFAQADLASLTAQQRALLAEGRRVQAELDDKPFDPGPNPSSDDLLQLTLYQQRQAQYNSRLRVFDSDLERLQASLRSTDDDRLSLGHQLDVARDVEGMRSALLQSQNGSRLTFLEAQAERLRTERDRQDAINHLLELQQDVKSKQAERQFFVDEWRKQLLETLVNDRNEVAKLGDGLARASRMNDLVVITAPEDGVVLEVAKRSVGSVMREAEPLVTIIPANAAMIAEISINSSDVGYVKQGDDVLVKVDAFPYQRHGMLPGQLISISEESYPVNGGGQDGALPAPTRVGSGAFHRGRVEFTSTHLDHMPAGSRLIPGMTLTAEIKVGARSVLEYFLDPILRGLREAIREP